MEPEQDVDTAPQAFANECRSLRMQALRGSHQVSEADYDLWAVLRSVDLLPEAGAVVLLDTRPFRDLHSSNELRYHVGHHPKS